MFVWQAHKGKVRSLAFSPDGRLLATATGTGRLLSLWNPVTGELVRKLTPKGEDRAALAVAFAPNAPLFAAGMTASVRVWSTETWEPVAVLTAERWAGGFYELAFGPGGTPRLAAGDARKVRVWENAGQPAEKPRHPDAAFGVTNVPSLDFSPDGEFLATNVLPTAAVWNPADGRLVCEIQHPHSHHHGPIKFSPDGTRVAVGYRNFVAIHPAPSHEGNEVVCAGHTKIVWSAGWTADGRALVTASADKTVRVWDPATGAERRRFEWGIGELLTTAFSRDGQLAAAAGKDGKVVVWDVDV